MIRSRQFLGMISGDYTPPISDMEAFTEQYPWCALGHKLLFAALCARGKDACLPYLPKAAVYVFDRSALYALAHAPCPAPVPESAADIPAKIPPEPAAPRIMVAGGDYFGKADFSAVALEEDNPIDRFIKSGPHMERRLPAPEADGPVSLLDVDDDEFMTETLAKIYADQSLHRLAMEAYQKLVLLYPKKSDYFASLIQEIKLKTNR